jgi:fructose-1,6-bisphosphatase
MKTDVTPRKLHDRIPVAIGSLSEIALYERFARGEAPAPPSVPPVE